MIYICRCFFRGNIIFAKSPTTKTVNFQNHRDDMFKIHSIHTVWRGAACFGG